jgi:hypothetical protein
MMKKLSLSAILGPTTVLLAIANSQSLEFKSFKLTSPKERVTGIYCITPKNCVLGTEVSGGGKIYASNGQSMGVKLVDGADSNNASKIGLLGSINFYGFAKAGNQIMALSNVSSAFISSKADLTAWTVKTLGKTPGGLNVQTGIGVKDDRWVMGVQAFISESLDEPSDGALWTAIWSPESAPDGFYQLWRDSNKTLCSSIPGSPFAIKPLQNVYIAADLSILAYPTNGGSRSSPDKEGVCLSSDGGKRFYRANLPDSQTGDTPYGVTCISSEKCFTFSNKAAVFYGKTDFIYFTSDARKTAASTWKAAKLPTMRPDSRFNGIFFAPDGKNGWAVGQVGVSNPLLLGTTDGGETWKDVTASVRGLAPEAQLQTGFALDANTIWLGTNQGTVVTSAK